MKIGDLCSYAPKSKIKAGEAVEGAKYMFFTSSSDESKRYPDYQLDGEGIIMGTGGNATLHYYAGKYATSTDCVVLLPNEQVRCKYLFYFFKANMNVLEAGFKGAGLKHTNKNYIDNICIENIPAYGIQDDVISVLDKVQGVIDSRKAELELLNNLIKSRFIEMFGDVIHNSKSWPMYMLSEIASSRLGKMIDAKRQTGLCNYPYLANFNVQWFRFNIEELNQMDFNEDDRIEFELKDGDLLVCEGGEIGRCAVWHDEIQPCFFQKALHRVRCDRDIIHPDYLARWFKYQCDHNGFSAIAGAKATIAHLPGVKLKQLQVAVPPLELQRQFAAFVAQVDKLKFEVKKSINETQLLFDSLMQKYFR